MAVTQGEGVDVPEATLAGNREAVAKAKRTLEEISQLLAQDPRAFC